MFNKHLYELFYDWQAWLIVLFLTTVTLVSSAAKYRLGQSGMQVLKERYPQVSDERWDRVDGYFDRWGAPLILLSFLPLLTWIIPPAAGAYGIRFRTFLIWAFLAKLLRYWLLLLLAVGIYQAVE
jgi:membrane protein YqaA with SNARE-associated domain